MLAQSGDKAMKFTVLRNKIVCSREDNTIDSDNRFRQVVEFDAHVETVPPHVAGELSQSEILELERFLADRERIRANPASKNLLEVLPGMLSAAAETLYSVEHINSEIFEQLTASIEEINVALEHVKTVSKGSPTETENMRESEAQKERLEDIKKNF
jgi:hypothetical protein